MTRELEKLGLQIFTGCVLKTDNKMRSAYTITNGKRNNIGIAYVRKDGSISVVLDSIPVSTTIYVDAEKDKNVKPIYCPYCGKKKCVC